MFVSVEGDKKAERNDQVVNMTVFIHNESSCFYFLVHDVHSCGCHKADDNVGESHGQKHIESSYIASSYAFAHPGAVVVESLDTNVAVLAMFGSSLSYDLADAAESVFFPRPGINGAFGSGYSRFRETDVEVREDETSP